MPKVKEKTKPSESTEREISLEDRIAAVEMELAELKRSMPARNAIPPGPNDWKQNFGRFKDDPTYEDAERLGRAWRRRQPKC